MIHRLPKIRAMIAGLFVIAGPAFAQSSNEAAIREVQNQQEQAWNGHDAHAFARLFADDADLVNVLGWHWKGRAEVERKLTGAFSFVFAKSRLHIDDVGVRPLSDGLALAYVTWSMTGAVSPDGSGGNIPQHGIQTQLLEKVDGHWLILSFQNTNAVPERPFPMAAAPAPVAAPAPMAAPVEAVAAKPAEADNRACLLGTRTSCLIYKKK